MVGESIRTAHRVKIAAIAAATMLHIQGESQDGLADGHPDVRYRHRSVLADYLRYRSTAKPALASRRMLAGL